MTNDMLFARAELWINDVISRHEALRKRLEAARFAVTKAHEDGDALSAVGAVSEAADDLAWTLANCQIGSPGRIGQHLK